MTILGRLLLIPFITLHASTIALAVDINPTLSGSWYNPNQNGHGLSVEVLDENQTAVYWYVYDPDGSPTFLISVGTNQGNRVIADTFIQKGMKFGEFDPNDLQQDRWGSITLTFESCDRASLSYQSNDPTYGSGVIPMQRLLSVATLQCSDTPEAGVYHGVFRSDLQNQGFEGFSLLTESQRFVSISYGLLAGFGTWSENNGSISGSGTAVSLDPNAPFAGSLSFNGVVSSDYRLAFDYNVPGADFGSGDFYAASSLFRRPISLSEIAGTYSSQNVVTGVSGEFRLNPDGTFIGADQAGCEYSGFLQIENPEFNYFIVSVDVSSCGPVNGNFQGLGTQVDGFSLGDRRALLIAGTNGRDAAVVSLTR